MYVQLNNIHLKLKTVCGDSGCCYKSCCTTERSLDKQITLYLSQVIVDVHDFILGWKIVYRSAQCLYFCPYALNRELIISIDRAFSFLCSVLSNKHHLKLIDATLFLKWAFIWTVLGAVVCASRLVCDYICIKPAVF